MQSLERAAALLRGATSLDGLAAILYELGFPAPALPLDDKARRALGLWADTRAASIAQGKGCLRGLALELNGDAEPRQALTAIAGALSRNSPQLLWIMVSRGVAAAEVAIVCWSSTHSRTHVVSLMYNRDRLAASDAETLCALSAGATDSDLLTHARWLDVLGREAITRRFFTALQEVIDEMTESLSGRASEVERNELALLYVSRLIFLSFLESRGWLDADFGFLINGYSRCIADGGRYQRRVLEPLFFGTLNTPVRCRSARAREFGRIPFLNGGLFARSHLEKQRRNCVFTDEAFGKAYGSVLSHYRFSGREDAADWSEASIDPEILGKTFETLMAPPERKSAGAFYTPQHLVENLTRHALACLPDTENEIDRLRQIRVLDPACGSGAFLVHMLERIAALRKKLGESGSIADIRRRVLTSSIFGVDLNPIAVWLCELRLWLSIVIETGDPDPMRIAPLPNLDRHIRVGDSLAGGAFDDRGVATSGKKIVGVRSRYTRAVGPRKRTLARALDRLERSAAIDSLVRKGIRLAADRKEILIALRARDLFGDRHPPGAEARMQLAGIRSRLREITRQVKALKAGAALPFSFAAHFSDVAAAGGFDVIIGNPPWVRLHNIPESSRERLRRDFAVYRNAAWESGATIAGAGRGFAAQIDLAALFVERSCELLRPAGAMALLLPAKLWRSLAGGGVRRLLLDRTEVVALEDLTESRTQFDAAVYPSLLVARRRSDRADSNPSVSTITTVDAAEQGTLRWTCLPDAFAFDRTPGSPWLLVPPKARAAFDRVKRAGVPFFQSTFGRPLLGVKTGCNRAFIVGIDSIDCDVVRISAGNRTALIERHILRPLARGESLEKWTLTGSREYIVWTHDENGRPLRSLPPLARRWLLPFHDALSARSDLHGLPWWSVFRTESANTSRPRLISADFGLTPRATVVEAGDPHVALNSCYVVSCPTSRDAHALATLLNSCLAAAWLNSLAEPARGGYRRYLGWTLSLFPIPRNWNRARVLLAALYERAIRDDLPSDAEILSAVLDGYELDLVDVQALLSGAVDCD